MHLQLVPLLFQFHARTFHSTYTYFHHFLPVSTKIDLSSYIGLCHNVILKSKRLLAGPACSLVSRKDCNTTRSLLQKLTHYIAAYSCSHLKEIHCRSFRIMNDTPCTGAGAASASCHRCLTVSQEVLSMAA